MFNRLCWGLALALGAALLIFGVETAVRLTPPPPPPTPRSAECELARMSHAKMRELVEIMGPYEPARAKDAQAQRLLDNYKAECNKKRGGS